MSEDSEARLSICLLGPFELWVDGCSVTERMSKKACSLLALLALRNTQAQTRADLATALWPTHDPENRLTNFRQHLRKLRSALGKEAKRIYERDHALQLDLTGAYVDVFAFREACEQGKSSRDTKLLEKAVRLYRGPLLQRCDESWVRPERERLSKHYLDAMEALAELADQDMNPDLAEKYLRQVIGSDPLRESAVRYLMQMLADNGDPERVERVYQDLRQVLQAAGRSPQESTRHVRDKIRTKAQSPASPMTVRPETRPQSSSPKRVRVPSPLTSLVGREKAIARIRTSFYKTRLVTLIGPGGVGKTRLAIEFGRTVSEDYQDGVVFIDLSMLSETSSVLHVLLKIAAALEVREVPGCALTDTITDRLASQEILLIIDNCEHVIATCSQFAKDLLAACPWVHLLATSREPLRVPGEFTYPVPSLALPAPHPPFELKAFVQTEAVRLFAARAAARQPDFTITEQNAPAIAKICHWMDGVPLAIELAAAMLDTMSVDELVSRLADSFWILEELGDRTSADRYHTLRATIEWSYKLLQPEEQSLLRCISVMKGSWPLEAAEAICADPHCPPGKALSILGHLVRKSMVIAEMPSGAARYRLLETIRQYAHERLMETDALERVALHHAEYFLQLAEEAERNLVGPCQASWLECLEADHENFRAALEWALETHQVEIGLRLAGALWRFWFVRGHHQEGQEWLDRVLHSGPDGSASLRRKALNGAGNIAYIRSDYPLARSLFEESLAISQELGDAHGSAIAWASLANVAQGQGKYSLARDHFEKSLAIFQKSGDKRAIALTLANLALVAFGEKDYTRSCDLHQKSLDMFRELEDQQNLALGLNNLADMMLHLQDYEAAVPLLEESLLLSKSIESKHYLAQCLTCYFTLAVKTGYMERAAVLLGAGEALREQIDFPLPPKAITEYERNRETVLANLGEERFLAGWTQGRAMTSEEIYVYALKRPDNSTVD